MQNTRPHNPRELNRSQHARLSVDGFAVRAQTAQYKRRSNEILPATDTEYMISLGSRASRRHEKEYVKDSLLFKTKTKLAQIRQNSKHKKARTSSSAFLVVGVSCLIFVTGMLMMRSNSPVTANKDSQQLLQDNGDTPNQNAPYNHLGYSTTPDLPKLLTIRKIGVTARVTRLSVRDNSQPKYPANIFDVGWYENSAKPGEYGAALMIGHISGEEKQGVFHDLTNLVPGDEFQLEMGDGSIKNYYIVKMEAYDRNNLDFSELTRSAIIGKPGLNLLTAVGAFEVNSNVVQQLGVFAVEKVSFQE